MKTHLDNPKVLSVMSGFFYFGDFAMSTVPGFVELNNASMIRDMGGDRGLAGVCRLDPNATVVLDRFDENEKAVIPISSLLAINPCQNLYLWDKATLYDGK